MTSIARELPPGRTIDPDGFRTRMADRYRDAHAATHPIDHGALV
jgi:hypothetical protein